MGQPSVFDRILCIAFAAIVVLYPFRVWAAGYEVWLEFCKMEVCEEVRLPLESTPTPYQCLSWGQVKAAEWLATKPAHRLMRVRCGKASVSL